MIYKQEHTIVLAYCIYYIFYYIIFSFYVI